MRVKIAAGFETVRFWREVVILVAEALGPKSEWEVLLVPTPGKPADEKSGEPTYTKADIACDPERKRVVADLPANMAYTTDPAEVAKQVIAAMPESSNTKPKPKAEPKTVPVEAVGSQDGKPKKKGGADPYSGSQG
jgi:hypothetical protein